MIQPKSNRRFRAEFERDTCKWCHLIENFCGKLKEYRGIVTRCCKIDTSFAAFTSSVALSFACGEREQALVNLLHCSRTSR